MKSKLLSLFLALAASVGITFASVTIDGIAYNLNETDLTAEVRSGGSYSGNVVIPSQITYDAKTYRVTSIGDLAFNSCSSLTSVTIPNSVTSIGDHAFSWCRGLTSVTIPNSVTSIGDYAFYDCSSLTSVTIPNSVTSIGISAFYGCNGLTSVTIGNSVTSIGNSAFSGCSGLTKVNITDIAAWCNIAFGNETSNPLDYAKHLFVNDVEVTDLVIPNSVTSIGDYAFYNCSSLTSVTIPNSVTSIGNSAFDGCSGLTSVTIPNSVTSIGDYAFYDCSSLTSVTIGNSVTSIGRSAFSDCSSLTSVTIPSSVTSIGGSAFSGCSSLTSVTIPSSVTSIGDLAFNSCSSLTSPVYNAHVFAFMPESYSGAYSIPDGIEAIVGGAFSDCTGLTSVTIPNSVTSIGNWAFAGCSSLTSVTIPNSVTSIGNWAFAGCSSLTSVTIPSSVTSIGISAFSGCSGLTAIYVPCGEMERFKQMLNNDSRINDHAPLPYTITINAINGNVTYPQTMCDDMSLNATPDYGYHFMQWSDGNTDNPRTIELTQDTTFTAEFAKNTYTISTTSANPEWGTTAGGKSALYLDEVEISATPNYGYHFVQWSDYNTEPIRTIVVERDSVITATFAKNVYSITKNAEHGTISGNSSAEYLDYVTLTATPDYGYHFTQWSDGLKDNPRIFRLTQDTTFTAEFAYDRVGQCGKDLALVWSYDPTNKVLTIGNAGEFTDNMQFGVEAPAEMEELVIGNSVTTIGENAFAGISTLKKVTIGESVKTIQNNAFYNCVNLETIFNYRPTPTNAYSTAFDGVDKFECKLYVLPNSIDMYKNASVWRDFYYTYAIGAEETTVTTNDVKVEPQDNAATVTWPTSENAASYTIQITKDGVVFCTLIFNANGQLTGIAFAPGRDGQSMAPAAVMTANGLQFTVTGLDSNTHYGYSLTAKDANEQPIATYSGSFTTTCEGIATGVDNTAVESEITKILRNGEVLILRDGKTYTVQGQEAR